MFEGLMKFFSKMGKKEEKTTIDGRKARQYNVKRVNQEMYPSG